MRVHDGVRQREENIEVGRVEKLDDLDVGFSRSRLVGEVQADGVVVEARDELRKGFPSSACTTSACGTPAGIRHTSPAPTRKPSPGKLKSVQPCSPRKISGR